ncbi:hypothetical protein [Actinokineospora bangkokensis]|uniref:Uncharacterized protein n=1 Tax=Actinokineospora bangkokensis TaxID=1193682 RepID=A0A1Q9LEI9_9PSEU|nr:hypothetical protein [Actinokineospora bangkokensis]OLR90451.1 hypothetical protein BJP25_27800 [Actinokineospora bangkokensis]
MENFLEPLRDAVAVLDGYTQLFVQPRGPYRKGVRFAWHLNEDRGARLGDVGVFYASMKFEIIDADPARHEAPLRVTTKEYNYCLEGPDGKDLWRFHWHPDSKVSHERGPHMHTPPTYREHWPTPRMTLEKAVLWCVRAGAPLSCTLEEAERTLALTEGQHVLWRGWSNHPEERRLQST